MDRTPCRVTAELNSHESALNAAEQETFDEWNSNLMHDICGKRLSGPVQDLLIAYSQFQATRDSFGVDAEKFVQFIAPMLKSLREACIDEWKDL